MAILKFILSYATCDGGVASTDQYIRIATTLLILHDPKKQLNGFQ
jgi:hypothetical protein